MKPPELDAFDVAVLRAYLATATQEHTGHAQAICSVLRLPLSAQNIARVLRSIRKLERAARELHAAMKGGAS